MSSPRRAILRLDRFVRGWPHGSALVGGLAVIARVRARTTDDADLVVHPGPKVDALLEHAKATGYTYDPDGIDEWLAGGLVRLRGADGDLDVIVADDPFLRDVVARATAVSFGVVELPVATVEDLLLLKLAAHRPIDLDDALAIKDALADRLDRRYLREQGARLDIDALAFLDGDG